jgi:L-amino acid N-acyltransferase YncA
VRRVITYARAELGLHALIAYYHPDNRRSERLLERNGFRVISRSPVVPGFEHLMRPHVLAVLSTVEEAP